MYIKICINDLCDNVIPYMCTIIAKDKKLSVLSSQANVYEPTNTTHHRDCDSKQVRTLATACSAAACPMMWPSSRKFFRAWFAALAAIQMIQLDATKSPR